MFFRAIDAFARSLGTRLTVSPRARRTLAIIECSRTSASRVDLWHRTAAQHALRLVNKDWLASLVEVLRLDGATYRIVAAYLENAKVRAEPFDAIELDLSVLWAR